MISSSFEHWSDSSSRYYFALTILVKSCVLGLVIGEKTLMKFSLSIWMPLLFSYRLNSSEKRCCPRVLLGSESCSAKAAFRMRPREGDAWQADEGEIRLPLIPLKMCA